MTSKERTSLTQNAEAHIKALSAVIDRLAEMRATEQDEHCFAAQPAEPQSPAACQMIGPVVVSIWPA